jgi:hypothetical protein
MMFNGVIMPIYPTSADLVTRYTDLLGTFWVGFYGGSNLVYDYCRGVMINQQQLQQNLVELQESVGRSTIPVLNTENWYAVDFYKSQEVNAGYMQFGDGHQFGTSYTFGQLISNSKSYPLISTALQLGTAVDQISNTRVTFTAGVDYLAYPQVGIVTFLASLFTNPNITPQKVVINGVTDYRVRLFFFKAGIDRQWLTQQFGYVFNLNYSSSVNYKTLINAIFDSSVSASNHHQITNTIAALTDTPVVKNDGEIVKVIASDANSKLVITDQNVYKFNPTATVTVTVGQVVNKSDQLVDTVQVWSNGQGKVPSFLTALTLGEGFINKVVAGPLTFNNSNTSLVVTPNVSGYTKVEWSLGGNPADVATFFTLMHTKGVAAGKTLAMCMDTRPQPQATQPTAASLPATVNPMLFLFQNVLRDNVFVVDVKSSQLGSNALGLSGWGILRQIIPPHSTLILVVE